MTINAEDVPSIEIDKGYGSVTLVNPYTKDVMNADHYALCERGMPDDYIDAGQLTLSQWLYLFINGGM